MNRPLICMTLAGKTLEEDYALVKKYENQIDLVELRVDFLNEDEQLYVKRFPALIYHPCILTIRRKIDGGLFNGGEFSRTNLFGRALAFANPNKSKNFAYVDFEEDFQIPSIQDVAMAFGVRIIRSFHNMNENVINIKEKCDSMRKTGYEIPKIDFFPNNLSDVATIFAECKSLPKYNHIVTALGVQGLPSRILAELTGSYLTYISPEETLKQTKDLGYIDPKAMIDLYNFKNISSKTKLFGLAEWSGQNEYAIQILNHEFQNQNIDAVLIPLCSPLISDCLYFAEQLNFSGLIICEPFLETTNYYLSEQSSELAQIGSCNTVLRKNNKWQGINTLAQGFKTALEEFLNGTRIWHRKIAVIGAGGLARTVAYILHQKGAKVCIFNRTIERAQIIAEKYGFFYSTLEPSSAELLDEFSGLIIQTTSIGSDLQDSTKKMTDPIPFYKFRGDEMLMDLIYSPEMTPLRRRASQAGCKTTNGKAMFEYSTKQQIKLFIEKFETLR